GRPGRQVQVEMILIALAPLVAGVGVGWWLRARGDRKRIDAIAHRLEGLGFAVTPRPSPSEREQFAAPILHLFAAHGVRQGTSSIRWHARERAPGSAALLCEHRYLTGSGKMTQEHFHTLIAWPGGHPQLGSVNHVAGGGWFLMG